MSSTYKPGNVPDSNQNDGVLAGLVLFLRREFASIKRGLEDAKPLDEFVILHAEPDRVRAGMLVYADGSDWNPGSGEGVYRRNAANTAWVFIGAISSVAKTTPVDADLVPLVDSAASNFLKYVTWANIKATLKAYFDTLYLTSSGQTLVLIQSQTASNVASVDFTTGIDSTYVKYILEIVDHLPVTNSTELWIRVSQAAAFVTSANYSYAAAYADTTSTGFGFGSLVGTKFVVANGVGNGAGEGLSGKFEIYNPAGTANKKRCTWDVTKTNSAGPVHFNGGGAMLLNNTAIDGLRILSSSGNISSGTFKLYGVKP